MTIYWVNIEVNFNHPMDLMDDENRALPQKVVGFLQEFGCTCEDENKLKQTVKDYLKELDWMSFPESEVTFDRIGEINPSELSSEIYEDPEIRDALIANPKKEGLWYASGKAFFSDNEEEEIYEVKLSKTDAGGQ